MEPPAQQDPVAPSNQKTHNTKINRSFMPSRCTNLIQDLQVAPTLHRFHPCRFSVVVLQLSWFPAAEKRNLESATSSQIVRSETKPTFGKQYSNILGFDSQEAFPDNQEVAKESSPLEKALHNQG